MGYLINNAHTESYPTEKINWTIFFRKKLITHGLKYQINKKNSNKMGQENLIQVQYRNMKDLAA